MTVLFRRLVLAGPAVTLGLLSGCTPGSSPSPSPSPAPTPTSVAATAGSASPSGSSARTAGPVQPREPTTSNTLPPPPAATAPAPSTAGVLDATVLPVPAGWRTVALAGGTEEGFRGNGSWVHARDPRYAAQDVITIGCADVTRDDYPDPVAALEGNYTGPDDAPGVGLALQFTDTAAAGRYWDRYTAQVQACETLDDPLRTEVLAAGDDLVDRRSYPDGEWTEVGRRTGARVTLVILSDPGHQMTTAQIRRLLARFG